MKSGARRLIRCVGAIAFDRQHRLLMIRRATEPGRGHWSLPGGRVQPDETDQDAVRREIAEETGLSVVVGELVGSVRIDAPDGGVYDIHDYACDVVGGTLAAGDDAGDARWVDAAEYQRLPTVAGLTETLRSWSVLPG